MLGASGWAFGWEALVAIATVLLALATAGLALTTRRMVRYTAQEVQSTRRPILLPGKDVAGQAQLLHTEGGVPPYRLLFPIRNAGAGPALGVRSAVNPSQPYGVTGVLTVGDEVMVDVPVFVYPDGDKTLDGYAETVHLDCTDIGNVFFTTALYLSFGDDPPATLSVSVQSVAEGRYATPVYMVHMIGMHMWRRTPLRTKVRRGWDRLFLKPGEPMRPLRPRITETWREIFPPKQQSYLQRVRMAIRAKPEWSARYASEPTGGPVVRPLRRLRRWIGVKVNTFQKHRTGF